MWVMKWSGAAPVPLARRRVDHITRADLNNLTAAGLHQPASFGHVQRLAAWMTVPGGPRTRCESHNVDAHAGVVFAPRDDVEPPVPGERLRRAFEGGSRRVNLHVDVDD